MNTVNLSDEEMLMLRIAINRLTASDHQMDYVHEQASAELGLNEDESDRTSEIWDGMIGKIAEPGANDIDEPKAAATP